MFWGYTITVEGDTAWLFWGWGGAGSTASFFGGCRVVWHCYFRGYSMVLVEGMALLGLSLIHI